MYDWEFVKKSWILGGDGFCKTHPNTLHIYGLIMELINYFNRQKDYSQKVITPEGKKIYPHRV